tara:strand:- start:301 stop:1230 length:930 start_codon:yes stop_codon:yes gene_type:complete
VKKYAIIIGIRGLVLTEEEKRYLNANPPLGIILFSRNIKDKLQVKALIKSIKSILGRNSLILIDQEGGKVSRLNAAEWPQFPSSEYFGKIALKNLNLAEKKTYENYKLIGNSLNEIGVNFNCAPCIDVRFNKTSQIIGSRSFSHDPRIITALAFQACKGLQKSNVTPILKHIPGHGRANEDSHIKLPEIDNSINSLREKDFYPFKKLNKFPAVMTAHIKYLAIDKDNLATHSSIVISEIIRKYIGFKGVIFSDDICMKALKGNYFFRSKKAIDAGCNIILKCDHNLVTSFNASVGAGKVKKDLLKILYK